MNSGWTSPRMRPMSAETANGVTMRSMKMTVERYGGTLSAGTRDKTFFLNMLIPLP